MGAGSFNRADHFDVDASRSSIIITTPSSNGKVLNGTTHRHHHWIHIEITAPDGRRIVEVSLSFDQFARALTTNTHVPCTLDAYWAHANDSVLLTERVRPPVSIRGRMERRLRDLLTEVSEQLRGAGEGAHQRLQDGKAPTKVQAQRLVDAIPDALERLRESADFIVGQGMEEAADGIERCLTQVLATNAGANPELGQILGLMPELPAPEADPS